ncbi:unnamed protein product [Clonostachys rosea]|uniref:CST complex subunit Stn1 N-terminal domain-containing protein n=1 Tax=Bionectria ochroleuca TaxID=29856 RepID=A0ABY6TQC1_BIOOC|nr:unnamed protein product [Clonostachys rosea]
MGDKSRPHAKLEIYPRYCFDLAPTHNKWCFLRAADVKRLKQPKDYQGQDYYFYRNLPIRWVRIVGLVVAIDDIPKRRIFTIDDSSGVCLEAVLKITSPLAASTTILATKPDLSTAKGAAQKQGQGADVAGSAGSHPQGPKSPYAGIDVGTILDIKGSLTTFRDERQIKVEKMQPVKGTMQEVSLWEKRDKFRSDILSKPWTLSRECIKKCQRRATRSTEASKKKRVKEESSRGRDASSTNDHKPNRRPAKEHDVDVAAFIREGGAKGKFGALGL